MKTTFQEDLEVWRKGFYSARYRNPKNPYEDPKHQQLWNQGLRAGLEQGKGKRKSMSQRRARRNKVAHA